MKVVINPAYNQLSEFIHKIPNQIFSEDSIIRDSRNTLRKVTVDGYTMVIKQYKKPSLFNRFAYSFIRKSKAQRSYEYAFRLLEMGFGTADPIAYIEQKKGGLLYASYFVSLFLPYSLMSTYDKEERNIAEEVMSDFINYTVTLHKRGIIHYDYNFSNILYHKKDGSYQFSLIDINRIKFNRFSKQQCIRALRVIGLDLATFVSVNERYADLRGWDAELFCGEIVLKRGCNNRYRRRKQRLKVFLGISPKR